MKQAKNESFFGELFVPGALAYITFNPSIKKEKIKLTTSGVSFYFFSCKDFQSEVFEISRCYDHRVVVSLPLHVLQNLSTMNYFLAFTVTLK